MTNKIISAEEELAINELGGFEQVIEKADGILRDHGVERSLFSKHEKLLIRRNMNFKQNGIEFRFDAEKCLQSNIQDLLQQAESLQKSSGGTNYVGAMLQHLVGAKLDVVLGEGKIHHHGFSVADQFTARQSDFHIESVAIHVTTHPSEALIAKCAENLQAGLKPLIITLGDGVKGAVFLLKSPSLSDRVDVLDIGQFLTANVYERSFFKSDACKVTFSKLLKRYNEIVNICETDPALRIVIRADEK